MMYKTHLNYYYFFFLSLCLTVIFGTVSYVLLCFMEEVFQTIPIQPIPVPSKPKKEAGLLVWDLLIAYFGVVVPLIKGQSFIVSLPSLGVNPSALSDYISWALYLTACAYFVVQQVQGLPPLDEVTSKEGTHPLSLLFLQGSYLWTLYKISVPLLGEVNSIFLAFFSFGYLRTLDHPPLEEVILETSEPNSFKGLTMFIASAGGTILGGPLVGVGLTISLGILWNVIDK